MISKYLTDLGIKEDDTPWGWNSNDKRQEEWSKERETYGFDERETWSLDYTFQLWFYPRLKMYDEINIVDTSYHKFEHNGETYTFQECIDYILKAFEESFKDDMWRFNKELSQKVYTAYELVGKILPALWW